MLRRVANVGMTYVPFPGNAPTVNAILGAHVTSAVANYVDLVEHLKAGKLRALATFTPARIEPLPELPTIAGFRLEGSPSIGTGSGWLRPQKRRRKRSRNSRAGLAQRSKHQR